LVWRLQYPLANAAHHSYRPCVENAQINQYIPVLMLGLLAITFAFGVLIISVLFGAKGKRKGAKDIAYECGMLPVGEGNTRMSVNFYLVAMLFILFDIEVVFLYPWAVVYKDMLASPDPEMKHWIFGSMISFLGILFVGYIYALKKRAFDWKS
jgi:NADH-quinone oxidoreductase subunit A